MMIIRFIDLFKLLMVATGINKGLCHFDVLIGAIIIFSVLTEAKKLFFSAIFSKGGC